MVQYNPITPALLAESSLPSSFAYRDAVRAQFVIHFYTCQMCRCQSQYPLVQILAGFDKENWACLILHPYLCRANHLIGNITAAIMLLFFYDFFTSAVGSPTYVKENSTWIGLTCAITTNSSSEA